MRKSLIITGVLILMLGTNVSARTADEDAMPTVDQAFKMLGKYQPGESRKALIVIEQYVPTTTFLDALRNKTAERLAAIVVDVKNTTASRSFACRQLALVGGDAQVPMLAKLLKDPAPQSDALYALVAIPGKTSGEAIFQAFLTTKEDALVPFINAIGERRLSVNLKRLSSIARQAEDKPLKNAAIAALGNIGNGGSYGALSLQHRAGNHSEEMHKAIVTCADLLNVDGNSVLMKARESLYRQLFASTEASKWRVAGLKGLCELQGKTIMQDLSTAILSDDPFLRASAIRLSGTVRSEQRAVFMSQWMPKLKVDDQARLIDVIGERNDAAGLDLVKPFLKSDDALLQSKAIKSVANIGDVSMVDPLVELAVLGNNDAKDALLRIRGGANTERAIIKLAAWSKDPAVAVVAIDALAGRNAKDAGDVFTEASASKDTSIRLAAWKAIASTRKLDIEEVIDLAIRIPSPDKGEVRKALEATANRIPYIYDNYGAVKMSNTLQRHNPGETVHGNVVLMQALAGLGTKQGVEAVRLFLKDDDETLREGAVRALSEWTDSSAGEELLKIAQNSESLPHRTLAMRGYLRLASAEKNAEMLAKAKELLSTPDAKRQLLSGLSQAGGEAALKLAASFLADSDVKDEAVLAVLTIADPIASCSRSAVSEALAEVEKVATDKDTLARVARIRLASFSSVKPLTPAPYGNGVIDKRRKAIAAQLPKETTLVAYMDCGMESVVRGPNGCEIVQPAGSTYIWPGAVQAVGATYGTIGFDSRFVSFEVSGLQKDKHYALGFSWWDYDANGRKESVLIRTGNAKKSEEILPGTQLPAFGQGKQLPAEFQIAIKPALTAEGKAEVIFQSQVGPNAVVSEIWLLESSKPIATKLPKVSVPMVAKREELKKVLIITGRDYPAHKWRETTPVLEKILADDKRFEVFVVEDAHFLDSAALGRYDTILLHYMDQDVEAPGEQARKNLTEFVKSGKGLVLVHFSCGAFQDWPEFVDLVGRVWDPKLRGHDKRGPFKVDIINVKHPITEGMKDFDTDDELYTCLAGKVPINILATAVSNVDNKTYPIAFVLDVGKGRVFHTVLGHDVKAFSFPGVGNLIRRGTVWASGLPQRPAGE